MWHGEFWPRRTRYDEDNESEDGRRGHARTQGGTIVKGKMQREVGRPPCFGIDDGEGGDIIKGSR